MALFDQMMTFAQVVEQLSFSQAASKLGLSAGAVSRQIQQLEQHLGVQLVQRTTRRLTITDLGSCFYQHCKELEQKMADAQGAITQLATPPRGTLRLLIIHYFARTLLLPHLAAFRQRFPELRLHIEVAERYPDFDKEQFDIILGYALTPTIPQQMVAHLITTTHYVLSASPDYLKQQGCPEKPHQLKQHQFIRHTLHHPYNKLFFRDGSSMEIPQPWLLVNNADALLEAALAGLGIAQFGHLLIKDLLANGGLVRLLPEYPMPEVPVYLFYHYNRYQQPKIKQFIDFIDERFDR